jgi:organic hydroperoxide reductase OsmC/OhrA
MVVTDKIHRYQLRVDWTGNLGDGTSDYRSYARRHEISAAGKQSIDGSSDPTFRGERDRWNPEELLVAALSQCHLLSYLHLAASNDVVVIGYLDEPVGTMVENPDGSGEFTQVVLRPQVTIAAGSSEQTAQALHEQAHALCFIARSVNFPVHHEPTVIVG